jgi:MFS family permease
MKTRKNYLLLATGLFISLFGSQVYTFAMGLYVLNLTGNAGSFANTLIFGMLPIIFFSPLSGVLADRYNKKRLIVSTDFINACLFLFMYYISSINQLSLPIIYGITFLVNTVTSIFDASMSSSIVILFDKDKIPSINATAQVIRSSAIILAPVVGGLVFSFVDISLFILINAISFIVSSFLEWLMDFPSHKAQKTKTYTLKSNLIDGANYIMTKKTIHPYIIYLVVLNFTLGLALNVPFPYIINTLLKRPPALLGSIQGFFPVGLLVGGLVVTKFMKRYTYDQLLRNINRVIIILLTLAALPGLVSPSLISNRFLLIYYGIINFIFGLTISFIDVSIVTILHQQIELKYQGRVHSLVMSYVKVIYPIGLGLSGYLIQKLNPFLMPVIGGFVVLGFSFYFNRQLRLNEGVVSVISE